MGDGTGIKAPAVISPTRKAPAAPPDGKMIPVSQLMQKEYVLIEGLPDDVQNGMGELEDTFTAIVWGNSGNGKTTFVLRLLKALQGLGTILYCGFEEGHGKSFRDAVIRAGLQDAAMQILDKTSFAGLVTRLKKKQSPKIIVIDSLQYSRFTYEQYQFLKENFCFGKTAGKRKMFLFISHATGKNPKGGVADSIMYDVNIKIRVEGFIAFIISRFANKMNYCIAEQRAKNYWGKEFNKKLYGLEKLPKKQPAAKKASAKKKYDDAEVIEPEDSDPE